MPGLTVCPESKTNVDKFNLTRILEKFEANETLTANESKGLQALSQICDFNNEYINKTVNITKNLHKIANNFADNSFASIANSEMMAFKTFAHETITGEGICYSFNVLDRKDLYKRDMIRSLRFPRHNKRSNWTVFGYDDETEAMAYPIRILGSGKKAGISIVLRMRRKDIDYSCKDTAEGFRLTLHTPDETAMPASHFYRIPFDAETLIAIQPRVMSTSDNLKRYEPKKRQCFFPGERHLNFFKSYTQSNCKLECLTGEISQMV